MSLLRYLFDSDLSQRFDIEALQQQILRRARTERIVGGMRARASSRIDELEREVGELALLCRALYVCLRDAGGLDAERFARAVSQVDASDGAVDGRATSRRRQPPAAPVKDRRRTR